MKTTIFAVAALAVAFALPAQDKVVANATAEKTWTTIKAWPMEGCVVSGLELKADKAKTFEVDGRVFKTCSGRCQKKVEADPAKYGAKLDKTIIGAQLKSYPLDTCPLTKKKLNDKARNVVLNETLVRVCCGRCVKKAPEKADELVAAVEAASHQAQAASYPLTTCPISGEKLDAKATEVMYGGTLVRFCCDDCIDDFKKAPMPTLAKLAKVVKPAAVDKVVEDPKKGDGKK